MPYIEQLSPRRNYRPAPVAINMRSIQAKNLFSWWPMSRADSLLDHVRRTRGTLNGSDHVQRYAPGGDWSRAFNQVTVNGMNIPGTLSTYCTSTAKMFTAWVIRDGSAGIFLNGYSGPQIFGDCPVGGGYCALTAITAASSYYWAAYSYDSAERTTSDPTPVVYGRPYFLALVHYGGTLYIVVNGKIVNSVAASATSTMSSAMRIGQSDGPIQSHFGSIWDVRVYRPVPSYWRDLIAEMYEPATRYELYRNIGQRTYFDTGAPVGRQPPFNTRAAALGDRVAMGWRIHD